MRQIVMGAVTLAAIVLGGAAVHAADGLLGVELVERDGKVIIRSVLNGSDAKAVGIEPGDILFKVGTKKIKSVQDALDAKAAVNNNEDIPFIFDTPGGLWDVNARFETGQPYARYSAPNSRPNRK